MKLATRAVLVVLIIIALGCAGALLYLGLGKGQVPLTFSPTQVLGATWLTYKQTYVDPSGRTIDPSRGSITTSEGQSYTMLRAVWTDDKKTFDTTWNWTRENLQHGGDHLFSWLYGKRADGTLGVLTDQNGNVSAADADQDIALSLAFAYARWQDPAYLTAAKSIVSDIWAREVVMVNGTPYVVADDLEKRLTTRMVAVNPSYLAPADYRVFALIDPTHPWEKVVDSSYDLIGKSLTAPLDTGKSAGVPPDWVGLDTRTGGLEALTGATASTTTNFGFDAMRVPWRLGLDYQWYGDPRDAQLLSQMTFLTYTWNSASAIGSVYAHDGSPVNPSQSSALYGGTLAYFAQADPGNARAIYGKKLLALYNPDINTWKSPLSYYDDNWVWFGIALYQHLLPNLAASVPPALWQ